MYRVVKVKYKNGALIPEEPLDLQEGKEFLIRIIDIEERRRILEKYRGALGRVDPELIEKALEEAEHL